MLTPLTNPGTNVLRSILLLATLLSVVGCAPDEPIVTHQIEKSRSGLDAFREAPSGDQADQPATRTRMLVALFERPESTWFFKLTGEADQVAQWADPCVDFFKQIRFEGDQPKWELPEGWREGPEKPLRFATLLMGPEDSPVELAISSLASGQDLTLNINRWRGQLGLPPIAADNVEEALAPQATAEAIPYFLFDATGTGSGQMGGPPFASMNLPAREARAPAGIDFEPLEGWQAGPSTSMVPARFNRTVAEEQVQITVVRMPADANEWSPNVQRWAQQVELSLDAEAIGHKTSEQMVGGQAGQRITLFGQTGSTPSGLVGVMVKQGDWAWFFKLAGPAKLVEESTDDFDTFLSSITFL